MAAFPHRYTTTSTRIAPSRATIEAPPRPSLTGGPPPEFRGDATTWSPEHLLCAAAALCLFTTFEAYAARDKLAIVDWRDAITGVLDKTKDGLRFTSFTIEVDLTVDAADVVRAKAILDRAKQDCIVSNALAVPVTVDARIWEDDRRGEVAVARAGKAS